MLIRWAHLSAMVKPKRILRRVTKSSLPDERTERRSLLRDCLITKESIWKPKRSCLETSVIYFISRLPVYENIHAIACFFAVGSGGLGATSIWNHATNQHRF